MTLPNPFAKKEEISSKEEITCKCKNTDTMILCSCHFKPMLFKREDAEKAIKNGYNQCGVCRQIDLTWANDAKKVLEDSQKAIERLDPVLPEIPDLPVLVMNAIKLTISDFNKNPDKYRSICEKKLQLARDFPEPC